MLRLAHPAPRGQGTDPPARRHRGPAPSLSLTIDEARHLRAAAKNIARTYGSLTKLAAALGVGRHALTGRTSPGLAVALWRLTGVPVEELLTGKLAAVKDGAS